MPKHAKNRTINERIVLAIDEKYYILYTNYRNKTIVMVCLNTNNFSFSFLFFLFWTMKRYMTLQSHDRSHDVMS